MSRVVSSLILVAASLLAVRPCLAAAIADQGPVPVPGVRVSLELRDPVTDRRLQRVVAGDPYRLVLTLTTDRPFPEAGEGLRVEFPFYRRLPSSPAPQGSDPFASGYTRMREGPSSAKLLFVHPWSAAILGRLARSFYDIRFDAPLPAGSRLVVVHGDGPAAAVAPRFVSHPDAPGYKAYFCRRIDSQGEVREILAEAVPEILPAAPAVLRAVAPATVRPGEPFAVNLSLRDRHGNPVTSDGRARVVCEAVSLTQRQDSSPTKGARSIRIEPLLLPEEGGYRLRAWWSHGATQLSTLTNPVLVRRSGPRIYFGDLHAHAGQVSRDGYGTMASLYDYARDVSALDFLGKTDHGAELTLDLWEETRELVRSRTDPGRFIPFLGFEWTPAFSWGHRSVLYPGFDGRRISAADRSTSRPEDLWAAMDPHGGIGIPHMPSSRKDQHHHYDWSKHAPAQEPLVEIHSQWVADTQAILGLDTETNPSGVQRALSLGYRLGIIAGSDNHTASPGRTGGLAGVQADSQTRRSIWASLLGRRTFGTSGERILVELRQGLTSQGGVAPERSGPIELEAEVHGTAPVESVEVIRGYSGAAVPIDPIHRWDGMGRLDLKLQWADEELLASAFYYVRVRQVDGEMAWSSPIWTRRPGQRRKPSRYRPPTRWEPVTAPSGWRAAGSLTPGSGEMSLSEEIGGFRLRTLPGEEALAWPLRAPFYIVRSAAMTLVPGATYRLRCQLSSRWPYPAAVAFVDDVKGNGGYFEQVQFQRFTFGPTVYAVFRVREGMGPLRLQFYFPKFAGEFDVSGVMLDRRVLW